LSKILDQTCGIMHKVSPHVMFNGWPP